MRKIVLTLDAPSADPVTIKEMQTPKIPAHLDSGEPEEYDTSIETAEEIDNLGSSDVAMGYELSQDAGDFLVGVTSRFGRPVRFNTRLIC